MPHEKGEATKLSGECIEWRGARDADGYGRRMHNGKWRGAHRVSYEAKHGAIPAGMVIDHLCRNRACVNVAHLEAVTPHENWRRGVSMTRLNSLKAVCRHGHSLSGDNVIQIRNGRECRTCRRVIWATYRAKKRAAQGAMA